MPSKSPAQARLMAACAHRANYEKCPPVSVAKEFNDADARKRREHSKKLGRELQRKPT